LTTWWLFSVSFKLRALSAELFIHQFHLFLPADGKDDDDSLQVIEELEKIDDDCDKHGIQFVKIDDRSAAKEHGVKDVSAFSIVRFS